MPPNGRSTATSEKWLELSRYHTEEKYKSKSEQYISSHYQLRVKNKKNRTLVFPLTHCDRNSPVRSIAVEMGKGSKQKK